LSASTFFPREPSPAVTIAPVTRSGHSLRRESAKRGEIRRPAEPPPHVHGVLALQRSLGNRATAAVLQRMRDVKSGTEVPLDGVATMELPQLADIVGRLQQGELTATDEELGQIRNRLLDIRQQRLDAEIAQLEREIKELELDQEIEDLEADIARLEKEIADDEERERQERERAQSAPPSTPQLVNLVATPTLRVNAQSFVPSNLRVNVPSFSPTVPSATVAPLPAITADELVKANTDGRLQMTAYKWWSSNNFPDHNIEIQLRIDGRQWALAHVKWTDRNGPTTTNVQMATFKAFNGQSIPNGNIWGGAARDLLVAESLKHTAKAPPSGAAHADVLI